MSLFSSLYTGVNGMNAQSESTSAISTNIANSTTVGFKKTDTAFHDLVITNTRPAKFQHGGVFTEQIQRIDRQGALQQTQTATEMGILGQGFFAVKTQADDALDFLFTRNGSFSPDANGVLRNSAGFVLYGWPIDDLGVVSSGPDLSSLMPVDVDELNETFRQTSFAQLGMNLDAAEEPINPQVTFPQQTYPVSNQQADFSRILNVVDGDGVTRDVTFEFRHISGPMAFATSGTQALSQLDPLFGAGSLANINAGDTFSINAGGTLQEYIIGAPPGAGQVRVDTIGELTNHINSDFGGGTVLDAIIDGNGRLVIKRTDSTDVIAFTEIVGTPLTGPSTLDLVNQLGSPALQYQPYDINASYPDQGNFPAIANPINPNTNGWWEVNILTPDPADPLNSLAAPVSIATGVISFNSDGTLNATPDANGNIQLALNNINFDDASTTDTTSLSVDVAQFSQFAGAYNVVIQNQNGAEAGILTSVEIDRDGRVIASFTNSEEFAIFQVPVAKFVNPNGLEALTGTVFSQTQEAGDLLITEAGTGGAGIIRGSTIETSNVDLATEFAQLIVSQRAFQANSRVVNTVDEMTQQLRTLKQ